MPKSHVGELNEVYKCIFTDVLQAYPTLRDELSKDLARLMRLSEQRGLPVYLVDLPAVGKHLDRCLSNGEYKLSGLPLTKRFSNRVVIPKFLRGLYLLVFEESGRLKEVPDIEAIFFLRQILFAAKKAIFACSEDKVEQEVIDFADVDNQLPEPSRFWDLDDVSLTDVGGYYHGFGNSPQLAARVAIAPEHLRSALSVLLRTLDTVSSVMVCQLGSYDPSRWHFRHGPGAVSETTGPTNKYCWPGWSLRLEREFPIADYGYHSFSSWAHDSNRFDGEDLSEPYSRMVAVPKSFKGPRLIACEPTAHQWCQQNCWNYLDERSKECSWIRDFVHFRAQDLNQRLCREGSFHGGLATIDLSAASDRVTCDVVGQFFRRNPRFLLALQSCRTRRTQQRLTQEVPEFVRLRKFSTMGSACTFPVETLIFLAVTISSVLVTRGLAPKTRNVLGLVGEVAVFGDDIVVPVDSRELLVAALEVLYFKVNESKSFWNGKFRESCGVDAFAGVDVTPVYWKAANDGTPESIDRTVAMSNNFYKKYMLSTAEHLSSTLPRGIPTVTKDSGAFGLKIRTKEWASGCPTRWNSHLQRVEIQVLTKIASVPKSPIEDDTALLQFFTEQPDPYIMWESGVPQRPVTKIRRRWVARSEL